ncbi:MAG: DUF4175 family protein [Woeseiaceae bacterium]
MKSLVRRIRGQQYRRYSAFALSAGLLAALLARSLTNWPGDLLALVGVGAALLTFVGVVLASWSVRVTPRRIAEHLDRRFAELQDSTMLLVQPAAALSGIEKIQVQRTETALEAIVESNDVAAPFAAKVPTAWAYSLLLVAIVANLKFLPMLSFNEAPLPLSVSLAVDSLQIDIQPPAYTRIPAQTLQADSFEVPEGSLVRYTVAFTGRLKKGALRFDGSSDASLYPAEGGLWQSQWLPVSSSTYQVWADGSPVVWPDGSTTQGIAVIADEAPEVRLLDPDVRLVLVEPGLSEPLGIRVALSDDFGLAATFLEVTRSAGSGEQVSFEKERIDWTAKIPGKTNGEIEASVDLQSLGFAANTELYLQVVTLDNRPVAPLEGRSQTIIVRPPAVETAADLVIDNPIIQVMPEYFRSQRQIIIDSEALLANREQISEAEFSQRAQSLAIDQKALRLRYGEFMGEEQSGEPSAGPSDEDDHFVGDGHDHDEDHESDEDASDHDQHFIGDGHDHGDDFGPQMSAEDRFADAATAVEAYSHFHDQEEQATLFDPETRGLLSQALGAMWSSEAELRQFEPKPALPHQYRALALLKRVQRRSRALARRVGVSITPVDPDRRLTGELDEINNEAILVTPDQKDVSMLALQDAAVDLFGDVNSPNPSSFDVFDAWMSDEALGSRVDAKALVEARSALNDWKSGNACTHCRDLLKRFWRQNAPPVRALPGRSVSPPNVFGDRG